METLTLIFITYHKSQFPMFSSMELFEVESENIELPSLIPDDDPIWDISPRRENMFDCMNHFYVELLNWPRAE